MGKEIKLFKSEEQKNRSEVSAFLHEIADKIEKGRVVLRQAGEEITLEMPYHLGFAHFNMPNSFFRF